LAGGKIKYIKSDDNECEIEFTHEQAGSITIKWDIQKAKRAGIYDSNPVWKKYPSNMLRSRCVTDGVNAIYPACLGGALTESMAQDIPENNLPDFQTSPQTDYEDAEIVEQPKLGTKQDLARELRDLGLTKADMKAFGEKFEVTQEFIEECLTNRDFLIAKIKEFEDGSV